MQQQSSYILSPVTPRRQLLYVFASVLRVKWNDLVLCSEHATRLYAEKGCIVDGGIKLIFFDAVLRSPLVDCHIAVLDYKRLTTGLDICFLMIPGARVRLSMAP